MHIAAMRGHWKLLEQMVSTYKEWRSGSDVGRERSASCLSPECKDIQGRTPLWYACILTETTEEAQCEYPHTLDRNALTVGP